MNQRALSRLVPRHAAPDENNLVHLGPVAPLLIGPSVEQAIGPLPSTRAAEFHLFTRIRVHVLLLRQKAQHQSNHLRHLPAGLIGIFVHATQNSCVVTASALTIILLKRFDAMEWQLLPGTPRRRLVAVVFLTTAARRPLGKLDIDIGPPRLEVHA